MKIWLQHLNVKEWIFYVIVVAFVGTHKEHEIRHLNQKWFHGSKQHFQAPVQQKELFWK